MSNPRRPITAADVRELWAMLSEHYRTRVVPKAGSPLMKAAGAGLALLRIQSRSQFMEGFTTVVARRIYVPYTPGDAPDEARLWQQASTAVHEHQHVVQAERDGFPRFATRYLLSQQWRARYEAEAYGCDIELLSWAGRAHRSARQIANGLTHYGVGPTQIEQAFSMLRSYERADAPKNEATSVALAWLEQRLSV